jgi:hypothetical protein
MGAAVLAASASAAAAQPLDLVYERTAMTAAHARCALFAPELASALAAGAAQARGAALRAGASRAEVAQTEWKARRRAASVDCGSADMAMAAARVRDAFSGYARLTRLSYPGDVAGWSADRNFSRTTRWRLVQETRFGRDRLVFGLAGQDRPSALLAVGAFKDGARPYAARLLLRDAARTDGPYLLRSGSGATRTLPLVRRVPPRALLKGYAAEARSPAGADLLPRDLKAGWAFRFPAEAAQALAQLDPREAVVVEFLFPGDVMRQAYVEVGDFAAGRAFLQVASR